MSLINHDNQRLARQDSGQSIDDTLTLEWLFTTPFLSEKSSSSFSSTAETGKAALITTQAEDSLRPLIEQAQATTNDSGPTTRYFFRNGVLCSRWLPPTVPEDDAEWMSVTQVLLPSVYRQSVLALAHDGRFSGHLVS